MLPPIPEKLWKIDESTVGEHFSLDGDDRCYYIWEYTAGKRYDFSLTNQLITNLKIKPSAVAKASARGRYKQDAILHAGNVFIVIDDVLNSGKHFKAAQSLLTTQYPNAEIRGLFLARCIRESPDFDLPPPPTA